MIRKSWVGALAGFAVFGAVAAGATSIQFKDANGQVVSVATVTFNGVQSYLQGLIDTTGAQIDPATKQNQQAMLDRIGAVTSPAVGTLSASLATLAATVGTPGSPAATAQTVQAATGARFNVTYQAAPTNLSAAVTAGTATTLGALVAGDRGWKVQNRTTGICTLTVGGLPYDLPANGYLDSTPNLIEIGTMSVTCVNAGNFTAGKFS